MIYTKNEQKYTIMITKNPNLVFGAGFLRSPNNDFQTYDHLLHSSLKGTVEVNHINVSSALGLQIKIWTGEWN